MPVYDKVEPTHLDAALKSIIRQTRCPQEIVLVKDGSLGKALEKVIRKWAALYSGRFEEIALDQRRGVAQALQVGLQACSNDLVARMDADDISVETRFQEQVAFMDKNLRAQAVGGWIGEFDGSVQRTRAIRKAPSSPKDIAASALFRCPFNHMTVMYRKKAVMACGGYDDRFRGIEDYHLWARMLMNSCSMYNLPRILVHVRSPKEIYRRRGGWTYARAELRLQREFLRMGFIGWGPFLWNVPVRLLVRLLPVGLRAGIYAHCLREPVNKPAHPAQHCR